MEDTFTAVPLRFEGFNTMWVVLPEEGYSPESILREGFFSVFPPDWRRLKFRDVHMQIPSFSISEENDLINGINAMGIRRLLSNLSQTPYTLVDGRNIKIDKVGHNARVKIDEQGCEASAYTVMRSPAVAGVPEEPLRIEKHSQSETGWMRFDIRESCD